MQYMCGAQNVTGIRLVWTTLFKLTQFHALSFMCVEVYLICTYVPFCYMGLCAWNANSCMKV